MKQREGEMTSDTLIDALIQKVLVDFLVVERVRHDCAEHERFDAGTDDAHPKNVVWIGDQNYEPRGWQLECDNGCNGNYELDGTLREFCPYCGCVLPSDVSPVIFRPEVLAELLDVNALDEQNAPGMRPA